MGPRLVPSGKDVYYISLQHPRQDRMGDNGVGGLHNVAVHHVHASWRAGDQGATMG
jgi:hypothetical protein